MPERVQLNAQQPLGAYMMVEQVPPTDGRKMFTYRITNTRADARLGSVVWYGAWHQYVFVPAHDEIVLSAGCMEEVATFMKSARSNRAWP